EAVDRQMTPRHTGRQNDGPPADDIVAIEENLTGSGIDTSDRARDQYLRAEASRLFVARHAAGKTEIVLDARGGPGLTAGRLALHDDGAQSLGRTVNARCE